MDVPISEKVLSSTSTHVLTQHQHYHLQSSNHYLLPPLLKYKKQMSLDTLHSCKKLRSMVTKRELKRKYHIKKAPLPSPGKVTPSKIKG